MGVSGPETWSIGDQTYSIQSTYFLVLPSSNGDPELMFVAEIVDLDPAVTSNLTEASAEATALPVMQHMVHEGLYRRATISGSDGAPLDVRWIGAVLMHDNGPVHNSGFRTRKRLEELQAMVQPQD